MAKLLDEKKFWELYWRFERGDNDSKALGFGHEENSKTFIGNLIGKSVLGRKMFEYMRSNYHDYLLWESIYKEYMPKRKGAKILEIGSAPGSHLVRLNRVFGFDPYGVEYSERGVELNREVFKLHGIKPDNVIYADFFSDKFQNKYKGRFDIVISRGFIEDFAGDEVGSIIEKHIGLLTKGGYLFVSVPNMRGIYYIWAWLFDKKLLSEMNTGIMQKKKFLKLFDRKNLLTLFCGYYGTFSCGGRFSTKRGSAMRFVLAFLDNIQMMLNLVFRIVLRDKGAESSAFSPYLLFVGVKKDKAAIPHTDNQILKKVKI